MMLGTLCECNTLVALLSSCLRSVLILHVVMSGGQGQGYAVMRV